MVGAKAFSDLLGVILIIEVTPLAFPITSLCRTNCVDFVQIQDVSSKNCGGVLFPLPTNLGMHQSPFKWFTWLKTSTTSNPTARLTGP